jgi:glycosyltransferase involved in cell wall biosynthesis
MQRTLSIIIPCLNEGISVEIMVYNIINTIGIKHYEIIVINSGGTETSNIKNLAKVNVYEMQRQGAPQARNFGAEKAYGDILLFADAHNEFKKDWGFKILNAFEFNPKSIITPRITVLGDENSRGCGFKWIDLSMKIYWLPDLKPEIHEIPFACSCCMALEKNMFNEIGQFDSGIRFWGEEDSELSIRAWLMGHPVLCDPSIRVGHLFRGNHPYNIEWPDTIYNKIRFAFSHFGNKRMVRHLRVLANLADFERMLFMVLEDNVLDRRKALFEKRIYTDDWFFKKFPMDYWV